MGILVWQVLSTGFFSKQTLLFSTLVNLYQFYYLFPLRNRTTDVATQLMWKREKGSSRKLKKNLEKTCGHIVSTDHHLSYIYTFTQHSWAYFQNQSFQSLQILCPACFLILRRRQSSLKLGPLSSTIFICAMRQIFEFTVSTTYYLYLSTYKSYYY